MGGIDKIVKSIEQFLTKIRVPAVPIPAILLLCSVFKRGGMSCMFAAASAIKRQSEFDAPTGELPEGADNKMNKFIYMLMCEIFKEIRLNSVVEAVVPPGTIVINSVGTSPAGPVTTTGSNIMPIKVTGLLR